MTEPSGIRQLLKGANVALRELDAELGAVTVLLRYKDHARSGTGGFTDMGTWAAAGRTAAGSRQRS